MSKILPLNTAPAAFAAIARKVNEIIHAVKPLKAGVGIKIVETPENILIAANINGLPSGYGPEEFTICDSGTPVTRKFITNNPD